MLDIPYCMKGIECGDLATWISSAASFAAVIAALYLARRSDRPRAKGSLSIVVFTPEIHRKLVCYKVTNLGTHSLRVSSAFLELHPLVRRFIKWPSAIANNWQHVMNSRLPADLQRGESFIYSTDANNTFGEFLAAFPAEPWLIVRLVRAGVATPWGPIYVQIDKDMREQLMKEIEMHRANTPVTGW
ncbi:MAG: hypothetical protein EOP13_14895 [Pseudomonas sp.]|uniref:hypothetical protein n=1 Tax=Pseudomonas sp. TaxID=306 RepID=UPI00121AA543|nr:hypothetical protein [Pseudomonas sp.]RZI72490.1 MAG: hypothetical protein EOP13_14895 [Pseudomonas sp.]